MKFISVFSLCTLAAAVPITGSDDSERAGAVKSGGVDTNVDIGVLINLLDLLKVKTGGGVKVGALKRRGIDTSVDLGALVNLLNLVKIEAGGGIKVGAL